MQKPLKEWTDFFKKVGADEIAHSEKTYLAHAASVYHDLQTWNCGEDLCRAGLFHSIYGTELFQKFALPLDRRGELRDMIGERAEMFAYWNCAINREAFDQEVFRTEPPYHILDRFTGEPIEASPADFDELCTLHVCDWLEQVPRTKNWDYRRNAYRQMAVRLGGIAIESYDRVFTQKAAAS